MLRALFASLALLAAQSAAAPTLTQVPDNQFAQVEGPSVAELKKLYAPKAEVAPVLDGGKDHKMSAKVAAAKAALEAEPEAPAPLDGGRSGGVGAGVQARLDEIAARSAEAPAPAKAKVGKRVIKADNSWIK